MPAHLVSTFALLVSLLWSAGAPAASGSSCQLAPPFKVLHDLIPAVVGDCRTNERYDPLSGDGQQETTGPDGRGGLLVWRKADNWTAFTDGHRTWVLGPKGLQVRLNTELLPWERSGVGASLAIEPIRDATVLYYDVHGSSEGELYQRMKKLGPMDSSGTHYDSVTSWEYTWRWPTNPDGTCRLSDVEVSAPTTVVLPRWVPAPDSPPSLVQKWTAFTRALAEHEQGHVDRVTAGTRLVADAIRGATCGTASEAAQAAADRILQENADYDAATSHGATQGAVFP